MHNIKAKYVMLRALLDEESKYVSRFLSLEEQLKVKSIQEEIDRLEDEISKAEDEQRIDTMYHIVLVKHNGYWSMEFGDYERSVAKQEAKDIRYSYGYRERDVKVITIDSDTDETISRVVNEHNMLGL
jgi:low affinity Fe/Cu permease